MKKILIAILGVSALTLSSCSNQSSPNDVPKAVQVDTPAYVDTIATPAVINQLLNDKQTPTIGSEKSTKAVIVFFDYACARCNEISKQMEELIKVNPNVKFIFKAYPSLKRDAKVANYATLVSYEAYLQGGQELFKTYNKAVFAQREANGKLTHSDVDNIVKQLGIKADQEALKKKAEQDELESRALGKLIGFHGPHSVIVLPTNMAKMNADQLIQHKDEVYVISSKMTERAAPDNVAAAKWISEQVQSQLTKF